MPGPSPVDDAAVTNVTASVTAVTLFAATDQAANRLVVNDSTSELYLKYGSGASTSSCSAVVPANKGYFEFPAPVYPGLVTGIWLAANGTARCTEVS